MKLAYAYQATLAPALAAFYFNGNELLGRLTDPTPRSRRRSPSTAIACAPAARRR